MTLTYAGQPLACPNAASRDWLAAHFKLSDVVEFAAATWPGKMRESWAGWTSSHLRDSLRPVKVGSLWWPNGAARFAVFHGLVGSRQLAKIRTATSGGASPATLKISARRRSANGQFAASSITPEMYLLPPRPLADCPGTPAALSSLYLLTLVDARFFWWFKSRDVEVIGGTTTWATLLGEVGSGLGVSVSPGPYTGLAPNESLTSHYQYLPLLLDAAAVNTGGRLVRKLDGTVVVQAPDEAKASHDGQLEEWAKEAGGALALDPAAAGQDFGALVPATVRMAFPKATADGVRLDGVYSETKTLFSLALTGYYGSHAGKAGDVKLFHEDAYAIYDDDAGAAPNNLADLQAVTAAMATAFYKFACGRQSTRFAGIVPYEPEALSDSIEWVYESGSCYTLVQRGPWADLSDRLNHYTQDDPDTSQITNVCPVGSTVEQRADGGTVITGSSTDWQFIAGSEQTFEILADCNAVLWACFTFVQTGNTRIPSLYHGDVAVEGPLTVTDTIGYAPYTAISQTTTVSTGYYNIATVVVFGKLAMGAGTYTIGQYVRKLTGLEDDILVINAATYGDTKWVLHTDTALCISRGGEHELVTGDCDCEGDGSSSSSSSSSSGPESSSSSGPGGGVTRTNIIQGAGVGTDPLTITGANLEDGDLLVVEIAFVGTSLTDPDVSLELDGVQMTLALLAHDGGDRWLGVYYQAINAPSSSTIELLVTETGSPSTFADKAAIIAYTVQGLADRAPDLEVSAWGSGTAPDSGLTGTTAAANEYLAGVVTTDGVSGDTDGAWQNGFSDGGQDVAAGGMSPDLRLCSGYQVASATGTFQAAKTGSTSRNWGAACVTFK